MIYNVDRTYELIQAGLFTEEDCKEYKKYVLETVKYDFKDLHNYLLWLWNNTDNDCKKNFRVIIYVLYNINTMYKEMLLINKLRGKQNEI